MKNEFVDYEYALALKDLGFDEPCLCVYSYDKLLKNNMVSSTNGDRIEKDPHDNRLNAPLYQQVFNWFILNHKLYGDILPWSVKKLVDDKLVEKIVWYYSVEKLGKPSRYKPYEFTGDTPEEAKLECLKKLIEMIK